MDLYGINSNIYNPNSTLNFVNMTGVHADPTQGKHKPAGHPGAGVGVGVGVGYAGDVGQANPTQYPPCNQPGCTEPECAAAFPSLPSFTFGDGAVQGDAQAGGYTVRAYSYW
jgi:hypothetical protein